MGKQTATSPNTAPWQVTHLLPPGSNLPAEDYILLHPDAAKYIWFPDIYIGGLTAAAEPKTWTINNFALSTLATPSIQYTANSIFTPLTAIRYSNVLLPTCLRVTNN